MFSQTAEYALRAVVCLAQNQDRPLTTQEIAQLTKVPAGYLAKVLQALTRGQIIGSTRGIYGGFMLHRPARELSILQVIDAVAPLQRIRTCPLGLKAHGKNLCALHRKLDDALAITERAFRDTTIQDLLEDPNKSTPLCELTVHRAAPAAPGR